MSARPAEDTALRALVGDVVDTTVPEPMGAYLFGPGDPGAEIGRHVERTVFLEAFGNTPELLDREYGRYDPTSMFFCVVDHRRRLPVGTMRMILAPSGGPGLKSLNDLEPAIDDAGDPLRTAGVTVALDAIWDVATLAVMPEYQGAAAAGLVSLALYQSAIGTALILGIDWMVAILDAVVYRMTRLKFQSPFVPFAPARSYLGSANSLPVYLHVSDWQERLRAADPSIYNIIFEGHGVEAAVRRLELGPAAQLARRVGSLGAARLERVRHDDGQPRRRERAPSARRQATANPPEASAVSG
ncbi:MAG: hypothetical protein JWO62_2854 [Acidimicrobiaceae bacterium]|nr:hypothetical protein [Acidimicrobiaceae bacterium]